MMDKEHSGISYLELYYLNLIQGRFDSQAIHGAVATIERADEREVVFGLRTRSGGSAYTISRDILCSTDDKIFLAVYIANELISRFYQAMTSKEDDLTIAPMMERAEKAGYRADFTVIDEWSDPHA